MNAMQLIGPDSVRETLADALRLLIGPGRKYSVPQIVAATGIGETTLKGYLYGHATPGVDQWLKLCAVLGPSFAGALLGLAGLEARETDPAPVTLNDLHADKAALVARMAECLRDGRFDHREAAQLRPALEALAQDLSAFLASTPPSNR